MVKAPVDVAERLAVPAETGIVRRENWYFADNEPVQIGITDIPAAILQDSTTAAVRGHAICDARRPQRTRLRDGR
jgi:GntR family transcriptional regulator